MVPTSVSGVCTWYRVLSSTLLPAAPPLHFTTPCSFFRMGNKHPLLTGLIKNSKKAPPKERSEGTPAGRAAVGAEREGAGVSQPCAFRGTAAFGVRPCTGAM